MATLPVTKFTFTCKIPVEPVVLIDRKIAASRQQNDTQKSTKKRGNPNLHLSSIFDGNAK